MVKIVKTPIIDRFINCADYVEELPADKIHQNIKYVESYQKPYNRVIIKGSSDHIICIPEKQPIIIRRSVEKIPTLGKTILVGESSSINNRLKASESYQVDYKIHKDKIPEIQDFNDVININMQTKAEKMLSDADLLNKDEFNKSPKKSRII